ncbi:MAG: hypothetical protein P8N49_05445 [Opitutales bacterium]|nr:hypothetical protein [Opitutales bacterium]
MVSIKKAFGFLISSHQIGPKDARYNFVKGLASECSWSIRFAEKAIHEYKRFIYLLCVSSHPVTPSAQVDQVWHLHLLFLCLSVTSCSENRVPVTTNLAEVKVIALCRDVRVNT